MRISPQSRYRAPNYPTALQIQSRPDILLCHVPKPWLANKTVSKLLGIALAANGSLMGCDELLGSDESFVPVDLNSDSGIDLGPVSQVVAPIFKHGDGIGSHGCVAVTSPVYLSEAEALEVIEEAISNANLGEPARNVEHSSLEISRIGLTSSCALEREAGLFKDRTVPLNSDLYWSDKPLGIEFISRSDFDVYAENMSKGCSVTSYDLQQVASLVRYQVAKKNDEIAYGVLYDPVSYPDCGASMCYDNSNQEQTREQSKEQLRRQVQDLIAWFEAQGVI